MTGRSIVIFKVTPNCFVGRDLKRSGVDLRLLWKRTRSPFSSEDAHQERREGLRPISSSCRSGETGVFPASDGDPPTRSSEARRGKAGLL